MINKKGDLQISFGWLFAIIVGAVILFGAIYGIAKFGKTEGSAQSAKTSQTIGILLNPLESSFESARADSFSFPVETRIHNNCYISGNFGRQGILAEQKNLGKWQKTDFDSTFQNKYIFSENIIEGKLFYIFSKPFEFPFKVSDVIYIIPQNTNYCFIDAPEEVRQEIREVNISNLRVEIGKCSGEDVKVCFNRGGCDIIVDEDSKSVNKNGTSLNYETRALMYAAIFSSPEIYECQTERLMKRTSELSEIYSVKAARLATIGCENYMESDLLGLASSESLMFAGSYVESLEDKNVGRCRLW